MKCAKQDKDWRGQLIGDIVFLGKSYDWRTAKFPLFFFLIIQFFFFGQLIRTEAANLNLKKLTQTKVAHWTSARNSWDVMYPRDGLNIDKNN